MKQHALITGAGTGIGRALCERLIKKNHEVIGVGRRPAPLEKLKQDFGQSVTIVEADYEIWCDPRIRVGHEKTRII